MAFTVYTCWLLWREENCRARRVTLIERRRTNNKLSPYMILGLGFKLRPCWWQASTLTTVLLLLPIRPHITSSTIAWQSCQTSRCSYRPTCTLKYTYPSNWLINLLFVPILLLFRLWSIASNKTMQLTSTRSTLQRLMLTHLVILHPRKPLMCSGKLLE